MAKKKRGKISESRSGIPIREQLKLWVRAGGRCEFRGCSKFLHRDGLTLKESNYADIAHIVAVSKKGPRGSHSLAQSKRNQSENLMLACKEHHKLIDSKEHESNYPVELLRQFKSEHEDRIHRLT